MYLKQRPVKRRPPYNPPSYHIFQSILISGFLVLAIAYYTILFSISVSFSPSDFGRKCVLLLSCKVWVLQSDSCDRPRSTNEDKVLPGRGLVPCFCVCFLGEGAGVLRTKARINSHKCFVTFTLCEFIHHKTSKMVFS